MKRRVVIALLIAGLVLGQVAFQIAVKPWWRLKDQVTAGGRVYAGPRGQFMIVLSEAGREDTYVVRPNRQLLRSNHPRMANAFYAVPMNTDGITDGVLVLPGTEKAGWDPGVYERDGLWGFTAAEGKAVQIRGTPPFNSMGHSR